MIYIAMILFNNNAMYLPKDLCFINSLNLFKNLSGKNPKFILVILANIMTNAALTQWRFSKYA